MAGLILAGVLVAGTGSACGDDDDASPTPLPEASPGATSTKPPATTSAASPTPAASATATAGASVAKGLTGVFEEPRQGPPARSVTPPAPPATPFSEWDGSAVIYDVVAGKETNLGPGSAPVFSPAGRKAAWGTGSSADFTSSGTVKVIDLASGDIATFGPGRSPRFLDDDTVAYFLLGTGNRLVARNLVTGAQSDITGQEVDRRYFDRLDAERMTTPDGFRVSSVYSASATPLARGGQPWGDVKVTNTATGQVALAFQAFAAVPAGTGHIVVASRPSGNTVNLFLVAIATGQAEYVATTRLAEPNFPLVANDARIAWVDDFCGQPAGNLFVFERASKTLTEVAGVSSFVRMTPDGRLALGEFGARRLMDPATFETVATIPQGSDVNWTRDYRYASLGWTGGHGGLC